MGKTTPAITVVVLLAIGAAARTASGSDQNQTLTAEETTKPSMRIPQISQPPTLEEFDGMVPHGPATQLAEVSRFIQQDPSDGAAATQKTHVYLGYDTANLYIIWVCFDSEPGKIRAHMSRRENIYDDDFVEVTLDTFHDQRHGFVFATNPFGVQTDGLWTEGGNGPDNSWDTVWHSRGKLTSNGFIVWESIPFRSLRFHRQPEQVWGVTLLRRIARNDEWDYWPRVS